MVDVPDEGFELGGVQWGRSGDIICSRFDPGTRATRLQDVDSPFDDASWFGRDQRTPPTWAWELGTNGQDESSAFAILEALELAWDDEETRLTPGAVSALRYRVNGRTRRVYGRPRNFAAPMDIRRHSGYIPVTCDFKRADTLHYDDVEQSATIQILPTTVGGLRVPFRVPFSTLLTGAPRDGQFTVGGTTPTWATVTISAPAGITNPKVVVGGWEVGVIGIMPSGTVIEVDARPWARSALLNGGGGVLRLSRATELRSMRLAPGPREILFSGKDVTGTATATITWRDASKTL